MACKIHRANRQESCRRCRIGNVPDNSDDCPPPILPHRSKMFPDCAFARPITMGGRGADQYDGRRLFAISFGESVPSSNGIFIVRKYPGDTAPAQSIGATACVATIGCPSNSTERSGLSPLKGIVLTMETSSTPLTDRARRKTSS